MVLPELVRVSAISASPYASTMSVIPASFCGTAWSRPAFLFVGSACVSGVKISPTRFYDKIWKCWEVGVWE